MGRTLPHSIEAEEYLLSCCFLDGLDVVARCLENRAECRHRSTFRPIGRCLRS
jgi:hypothetical protein